jgi:hypothetical protein
MSSGILCGSISESNIWFLDLILTSPKSTLVKFYDIISDIPVCCNLILLSNKSNFLFYTISLCN